MPIFYPPPSLHGPQGIPTNTRHRTSVGLMLGQRRRRWSSIKTTPAHCIVSAGITTFM